MEAAAFEQMSPVYVLAELRACNLAERRAAARRLQLAARWADLNPGIEALPEAVEHSMIDDELGVALAAVAEFAAVHGVSTQAGRRLIADALELRSRLPRLWKAVHELRLPDWKACAVAQATRPLGAETTGAIDVQAAALTDRLTVRRIKRLALQAVARFEPEKLIDRDAQRWVRITADAGTTSGAGWVDGRLDSPDALDLEAALQSVARDLAEAGNTDDLDRRRAQALGVMARAALGRAGSDAPVGRAVQVYVHLAADAAGDKSLTEVGSTGQLVTAEAVRRWCGSTATITVRPVIDLNADREVRGYQPTDVIREQVALRDRTCVFPHCSRPAHPVRSARADEFSHDADHIVPYAAGGPTSTDNLACLCRQHHRLKTHTPWTYRVLGLGEYLWTAPTGSQFLRTTTGTVALSDEPNRVRKRAA